MKKYFRLSFFAALALISMTAACNRGTEPHRVGYIGTLTGRSAGLGMEGRDAFMLAVEQVNRQGGIGGKKVEVLIANNELTPEGIRDALEKMKAQGVEGVVGPMMSQLAIDVVPEAERLGLVLISPTVSTSDLNHRKDGFFRPHYSDDQAALKLAGLVNERQIQRVAIIQDQDNRSYVDSWSSVFVQSFTGNAVIINYSSSARPSFSEILKPLNGNIDAVVILANAPDTGLICQQLAKQDIKVLKFASCWSVSGPLVEYGAEAVEDLEFLHSIQVDSKEPGYLKFARDFEARFGRRHLFPAVHAYDATRILLKALSERRSGESLSQAILRIRTFAGLQYPLTFSDNGDLRNPPFFLTKVKKAEFCLVCNY